jgi:hypothetical protein
MGSLYIDENTLLFVEVDIKGKHFLRKFREVNSALLKLGARLRKILSLRLPDMDT